MAAADCGSNCPVASSRKSACGRTSSTHSPALASSCTSCSSGRPSGVRHESPSMRSRGWLRSMPPLIGSGAHASFSLPRIQCGHGPLKKQETGAACLAGSTFSFLPFPS